MGSLTFSSQMETLKGRYDAGGTGSAEIVYFELTDAFTSTPFPKADFRFGSIPLQKSKIEQPEKSRES